MSVNFYCNFISVFRLFYFPFLAFIHNTCADEYFLRLLAVTGICPATTGATSRPGMADSLVSVAVVKRREGQSKVRRGKCAAHYGIQLPWQL